MKKTIIILLLISSIFESYGQELNLFVRREDDRKIIDLLNSISNPFSDANRSIEDFISVTVYLKQYEELVAWEYEPYSESSLFSLLIVISEAEQYLSPEQKSVFEVGYFFEPKNVSIDYKGGGIHIVTIEHRGKVKNIEEMKKNVEKTIYGDKILTKIRVKLHDVQIE